MLRRTSLLPLRVLCLTMLPDGGALTPALKQLGYTPYTLRSSFQQGHASTHPIEWSKLLDGTSQAFPQKLLADYDCVVGPPGAMVYDTLLRQAPQYAKVILVEEVDKDGWATSYEAYMSRLQRSTKRASKNKITQAFQNMLSKMVVGSEVGAQAGATALTRPSSSSSAPPRATRQAQKTASSGDLRRTFAAEAAALKGGSATPTTTSKGSSMENTAAGDSKGGATPSEEPVGLQHPRAVALQLYEESVRMSIPASQLLVYRYGDGWEPLCAFLEKPAPSGPFPEYDDGLHVLGHLQDRIDFAHSMQFVLGGICVMALLITVVPRCTGVTQFFKDLYIDYQVAFGSDRDGVPPASTVSTNAAMPQTDSEKFEDAWRKRGGSVTRTKSE